ncbi:MAG: DUF4199 family protein [Flavobacteriia bacterium]|nr:DUF4199 family protein [Flavobacteriia bacterium]
MKITIKIALFCSFVWIIVKWSYHLILPETLNLNFTIFANMLLLTVAVSLGLYKQKKMEGFSSGNLLSDIKNGLTSGVVYALIVSLFILLYYSTINPQLNERQIEESTMMIYKAVNDPKYLEDLKKTQESFEVMNKKQITEELLKGPKNFYNAKATFVISLLSLVLFSTLLSIIISIIYRKILIKAIK